MKAVTVFTARAVPLDRADVDTDQIIPSDWLKRIERTGFGAGLFSEWKKDPSFVLNDPRYAGAQILLAGANFGCGSSREHAPWALEDAGFRAIVAPSFADIFRNNSLKIGLVPVVLEAATVTTLMRAVEADPEILINVDVRRQRLVAAKANVDVAFPLDAFTTWRLTEGLDDIGLSLRHEAEIERYEAGRAPWSPKVA